LTAIDADRRLGESLRKVSDQPKDRVEVPTQQDAAAIGSALMTEVVEDDAKLPIVVARSFHLCDGTLELCQRLTANIGNAFPGEALVPLPDQDCFLIFAASAR